VILPVPAAAGQHVMAQPSRTDGPAVVLTGSDARVGLTVLVVRTLLASGASGARAGCRSHEILYTLM
jgi:hypothetical protein